MPNEAPVQVVTDANSMTTIINNVNSLYTNAMTMLITYASITIALVGVLIPLLVTLFQWRSLKSEKQQLERVIREEIESATIKMLQSLTEKLEGELKKAETEINRKIDEKLERLELKYEVINAAHFHGQGIDLLKDGLYDSAVGDLCFATMAYFKGKDEQNAQITLGIVIDSCLPNLAKSSFENSDVETDVQGLISFLSSPLVNENHRHAESIKKLKQGLRGALVREAVK